MVGMPISNLSAPLPSLQVAEGIQQGGDTAIQTVAALIYGYLEVGCFQDGIATLFSPPEGCEWGQGARPVALPHHSQFLVI